MPYKNNTAKINKRQILLANFNNVSQHYGLLTLKSTSYKTERAKAATGTGETLNFTIYIYTFLYKLLLNNFC